MALVIDDVPADDEVHRRHVQGGGVDGVGLALFNDAQLVAFQGEYILIVGFGDYDLGRKLPGPAPAQKWDQSRLLAHQLHRFRRGDSAPRETVVVARSAHEVIEMAVGYVDGSKVAMMQRDPVGQRFRFRDGHESVDENGVMLASHRDQSGRSGLTERAMGRAFLAKTGSAPRRGTIVERHRGSYGLLEDGGGTPSQPASKPLVDGSRDPFAEEVLELICVAPGRDALPLGSRQTGRQRSLYAEQHYD
jgi:hypothetical protein